MPPRDVFILTFADFQLLDVTGPAQVFASANAECRRQGLPPAYAVRVISVKGGLVASWSGVSVDTGPLPSLDRLADATLVVAGGQGVRSALADADLRRWLDRAVDDVGRCCSVCTGAFLLAATGRLDGRRVATHWDAAETLARLFPGLLVQDDAIHVHDGKYHTSAGVTAGIDLCLALVEADLGRPLALCVAKQLVVHMKRSGGQRQFSSELLAQAPEASLRRRLSQWLRPRLRGRLTVDDCAQAMGLSVRSLHRKLAEEGDSPARLLLELRLELACRLLEGGRDNVKAVAAKSGFGTAYNLHHAFQRRFGVPPSEYRARFG